MSPRRGEREVLWHRVRQLPNGELAVAYPCTPEWRATRVVMRTGAEPPLSVFEEHMHDTAVAAVPAIYLVRVKVPGLRDSVEHLDRGGDEQQLDVMRRKVHEVLHDADRLRAAPLLAARS